MIDKLNTPWWLFSTFGAACEKLSNPVGRIEKIMHVIKHKTNLLLSLILRNVEWSCKIKKLLFSVNCDTTYLK